MSDLALFETDPIIRHGVAGTSVEWPSGVEVWAKSDRQRTAIASLFAAAQRAPEPWSPDWHEYQATVMEPLRVEIRQSTDAALASVLEAGDPS